MGDAVTRPAGTTPNGLPYPGSVDIHVRTPAALQALAEATEAKLSAVTPGIIIETFRGVISTAGSSYFPRGFTVPFTRLAVVNGWIGAYGVDDGGQLLDCYVLSSAGSAYGNLCASPFYNVSPPQSFTLHAIGWGPPR